MRVYLAGNNQLSIIDQADASGGGNLENDDWLVIGLLLTVHIDKAIQQCWGIGGGLVWGASKATFSHCFQTDPLPVLNLGIEMKLTKAIIHVHALGL